MYFFGCLSQVQIIKFQIIAGLALGALASGGLTIAAVGSQTTLSIISKVKFVSNKR
jgi:hypothetical protein